MRKETSRALSWAVENAVRRRLETEDFEFLSLALYPGLTGSAAENLKGEGANNIKL